VGQVEDHGTPGQVRAAALILGLEALALLGAAGVLIVKTTFQHADSVGRAGFAAAMAVFGAVVLALCARGLLACRPAARTPIVVLQLLALPVGYSLGFQAGRIGYGGPMIVAALAVLYLLFTPPARAALDRRL
jgi:hypothetical protein